MEVDAVDEPVEILLVEVGAVTVDRCPQVRVELFVRPVLARVADDGETCDKNLRELRMGCVSDRFNRPLLCLSVG